MARNKPNSRQVAFLFGEGNRNTPAVLGGKGAGLAELVSLGMPVPAGFTVSTSVARAFAQHGRTPARLAWHIERGMSAIERQTGKRFGDAGNPLLVSVRSGAAVSMPGMMDTVLNLGMNPEITRGLGAVAGPRFAWDCYRRFLAMFGEIVLAIPHSFFEEIIDKVKADGGVTMDSQLSANALEEVCQEYRAMMELLERPMIDDPQEQLARAVVAVLESWNNPRAREYRRINRISSELGTAVNVQAMVYGNRDDDSGTGVAFSRNVNTGAPGLWGEFLINAQGEDVVAGSRTPMPITQLRCWDRGLYNQLEEIVMRLDAHRNHVVDVEFTVESGRLFILQVRAAKLAPEAAVTVATQLVWDEKVTRQEALALVPAEHVAALKAPSFKPESLERAVTDARLLGRGLPASPGAAVGQVVTSSEAAVEAAAKGKTVILVRPDTSPDDLPGMLAAAAIVTKTGGATSHAAVVARGLGKPAVVGCAPLVVSPGQVISVDGNSGTIVWGEVELADVSRKKEVNIFLRWAAQEEAKNWRKPQLRFEAFEQSVSFNRLVNDFYLSDQMASAAKGTALASEAAQLRTQVHTDAAERIAMYLVVAIGGEVRHADRCWDGCRAQLDALVTEFNVKLDKNDRAEAQRAPVSQLKTMSPAQHVRFVELVAAVFDKGAWGSTYGGKKWANIALAAHGFLTGKLSHSVFADHAFDLQHNGGCVFGKNPMLAGDRDMVQRQLETKKHATSVPDLYQRLSRLSSYYCRFEVSPQVEALYRKGEKLGIWGGAASGKKAAG